MTLANVRMQGSYARNNPLVVIDFAPSMIDEVTYKEKADISISTLFTRLALVLSTVSLPIRCAATDADIEIFGSDVVLRQITNGPGGILALQTSRAIN